MIRSVRIPPLAVRSGLLLSWVPALFCVAGCRGTTSAPAAGTVSTVIPTTAVAAAPQLTHYPVRFTDGTAAAGIRWSYSNGATGQHLFVETTGGGVACLDYNADGLLDLFALQGGAVPGTPPGTASPSLHNALYRNNGDGTFTDVTGASGLDVPTGYGQGVAVGDYDNDGYPDLYLTAYGGSHLFRNRGNGTFEDVTARAGVADAAPGHPWPLSAAWGDYDRDGKLDLFVCHYAKWSPETNRPCRTPNGQLGYCRPQVYEGSSSRLYHNNGNGSFTDVMTRSGVGKLEGKSMGVVWVDYDEDGWPDLFVTNDTLPNFLLRNNHDGTFTDRAMLAGVAVGASGSPMSGMGIGVGDSDNDGRPDLFDTNFSGEPKGAWRNERGLFSDRSFASNLASTNLQFLGFGIELCDYDLDGWRDLVIGNGHVLDDTSSLGPGASYAQSQQLFHNQGGGAFAEDLRSLGDLVHPRVTRGLAVGDVDNDGDPDVLAVAQNGPLQLFRNDGGNRNHWITFRLEGTRSNRSAIGAKITLRAGDLRLAGWVPGGSSFCSASDQRVMFGLRDAGTAESVEVHWPSGQVQNLGPLTADRFYWLREGGAAVPDPRRPVRR